MMGLCKGLAHQAILQATESDARQLWLQSWRTHPTFGVIPSRQELPEHVENILWAFPVLDRYLELIEGCPLRVAI